LSNSTIQTVLDKKISDIREGNNAFAIGRVRMVREYIVEATGLYGVSYFERVLVGSGAEGYVDAIRQDSVLIALTHVTGVVKVGDTVTATGEEFAARFSPDCIGHVVDMFGEDRLVGKQLDNVQPVPVETADPHYGAHGGEAASAHRHYRH